MALDKVFKWIGVISAISSVVFYFIGVTTWENLLSSLSVFSSLFPLSFEDAILLGYRLLVTKYLTVIVGMIMISMLIIFIMLTSKEYSGEKSKKTVKKYYDELKEKYKKNKKMIFPMVIIIFLLISVITITLMPYLQLKSIEKKSRVKIMESTRDTLVLEDRVIKNISIIAINTNYCAYYDGNKSITIPTSKVLKISSKIENK